MPLRSDFTDTTPMAADHAAHHNDIATALEARIPTGGTTGQVLGKVSGTNHHVAWITASSGGGSFVSSAKWGLD